MSKQTLFGLEPIIDNCCKVKTKHFNDLREIIINNITNCYLYQASITPLQLSNLKESNGKNLLGLDLNLENILEDNYT